MQREPQLGAAHGRHADLADDEPGAEIGELGRFRDGHARAERRAHQRDDRIAGARDIEDLTRLRLEQRRRLLPRKQRHAALAARDQQRIEVELGAQRHALIEKLLLVAPIPDHRSELPLIRRQHGRAAIASEIGALGIDQDWP